MKRADPVARVPGDDEGASPTTAAPAILRAGRRWPLVLASGLVTLALAALIVWLPVPYVAMSPGPMFNTVGEYGGVELIEISEQRTYPVSGRLDMTTVSERGGPYGNLTFGEMVYGVLDPTRAVVPERLLYPEPVDEEDAVSTGRAQFATSQSNAIAAAMGLLGKPVNEALMVTSVVPDSPADGKLEPGDALVKLNGVPVDEPLAAIAKIHALKPGQQISVVVERNGKEQTVRLVLAESPDEPGRAFIGINVGVLYSADFPIQFHLENVGGPSAGLMFTLGLYDELTPADLTGGKFIAGTGTIAPDGKVGAIGGIAQKMAAARGQDAALFLAPAENCSDVLVSRPDGLAVAAVATAEQAVAAVKAFNRGEPVPTCESVSAAGANAG